MTEPTHVIDVSYDGERRDYQIGEMIVHTFTGCTGINAYMVPEHSAFHRETDVIAEIRCNGEQRPLHRWQAGDVGYVPAGTTMSDERAASAYNQTIIRVPTRYVEAIHDVAPRCELRCLVVPREQTFDICRAVRNLAVNGRQTHPWFAAMADGFSAALAASMLYGMSLESAYLSGHGSLQQAPDGVVKAIQFIQANLSDQLSLADIAAAAALSTHHFSRLFVDSMGTTPMRYVWHRRLAMAQDMLATTDASIAEIAYACGYSSQSHFTTSFKVETGVTPGAFRRKNQLARDC